MIIERFTNALGNVAEITKTDDKYNPYKVTVDISYADYESARTLIEQLGFNGCFKKIIWKVEQ